MTSMRKPASHDGSDSIALLTRPVARTRLADQVASQLTQQIASGSLDPGTLMPNEQALAANFGVGKSVIREAVKIIATRGLVTVQQGVGTIVNPRARWNLHDQEVTLAVHGDLSLEDLVVARRIVEPEVAALAAVRATPEDLEALDEVLEKGRHPSTPYEHTFWAIAFHEVLAEASHNSAMAALMSTLMSVVRAVVREALDQPTDESELTRQHERIIEAVRAGDAVMARATILEHLSQPPATELARSHGLDEAIKRTNAS